MARSDLTFESWLETQAPSTKSLKPILKGARSRSKVLALIAKGILIVAFFTYLILGHSHRAKDHRTTDEVIRDVLQNQQAQRPLPESTKPDVPLVDTPTTPDRESHASVAPSKEQVLAADELLIQLKDEVAARNVTFTDEFRILTRQDGVLFTTTMIAATITILMIVAGAALLFAGKTTVALIEGVVGLIPGTGTLLLRQRSTETRTNMNRITQMREDNLKVLQAIQATLLIPDIGKRSEAIRSLAAQLTNRALKSS